MQFIVCDSITVIDANTSQCVGQHIVEYQTMASGLAQLSSLELSEYYAAGFSLVGTSMLTVWGIKFLLKSIFKGKFK